MSFDYKSETHLLAVRKVSSIWFE